MTYTMKLAGWPKGVDNIHAPYELSDECVIAANNVDILDSGKIRRRVGSSRVVVGGYTHSLWADSEMSDAYFVNGTTLYRLASDMSTTAVVTGLMLGRKVSFMYLNGYVYWSNGLVSGKIRQGVNSPWGVPAPTTTPTASVVAGNMPPGRYQVSVTFVSSSGEEGAPYDGVAQIITLASNGAISLSALPTSADQSVMYKRIYVSSVNGEILRKIAQLPIARSSFTITNADTGTAVLGTDSLSALPPGDILAHRNGIVFVASGPYVYYSEPMRCGMYNPTKNFYMFPKDVDIMLSTPSGLHVCADVSYLISNPGLGDATQSITLPYGAVRGTGVYLPNKVDVAWFSAKGQVVTNGDTVGAITEARHIPREAVSGAAFIREQQGIRQIVTTLNQDDEQSLEYIGA